MSRKRRGFDIDLDGPLAADETGSVAPVSDTTAVAQRRGPMAAAITETAGSLRERAVVEAQIRAENDALAHAHVRLKKLGLVTDLVPLDLIDATKLARDRAMTADPDLTDLTTSIRDVGLSNPIRIEAQPDGRHELVQGYRRLAAYRALLAETGDVDRFGMIPATIMPQGAALERLYRQMVDENMVRKDISFAEMAQMAIQYAADPGITETEPARVVARLFGSASYAKRSHIRSFVAVMLALGDTLRHAPEMPRSLGLALAERLAARPALAQIIRAGLQALGETRSPQDELDLLRRHAQMREEAHQIHQPDSHPPVASFDPVVVRPMPEHAPIRFELNTPHGPARCTVTPGRIDMRLNHDLGRNDQSRLEQALQALLDRLA